MPKKLLHIQLLSFIVKKNKHLGFVEIKPFLLKSFPEETKLRERVKMKHFLDFLTKEQYIEVRKLRGIWFIQESGVVVPRDNISAIVRIKPKGVELIERNQINNFSKTGIIFSTIFGLSTILLGVYSINKTQDINDLELKIEKMKDDNIKLQFYNDSILSDIEQLKKDSLKDENSK